MRIVIHAGIHKTASTFFQQEVFPVLGNVIFIPRSVCRHFNDYIINSSNYDKQKALGYWEEILKGVGENITEDSVLLISNEDYYPHPYSGSEISFKIIERLIGLFGQDLYLFLFIRKQEKLLSSLYLQYIKTGGSKTLGDFFNTGSSTSTLGIQYFQFDKLIEGLSKELSPEHFRVFLFEDYTRRGEETLQEMYSFILGKNSLQIPSVSINKIANISLHPRFVSRVRFLNKFTSNYQDRKKLLPFLFFRFYMHYFLRWSARNAKAGKYGFDFNEKERSVIEISNRKLQAFLPYLDLQENNYSIN